jgi:hypothetical protein
MIQSIPQGEPPEAYSRALAIDVGSLQPNRGGLEIGCRKLRTTSTFRPKLPEVISAVREGIKVYEAASRALNDLPGQIARAEHAREQTERQRGG